LVFLSPCERYTQYPCKSPVPKVPPSSQDGPLVREEQGTRPGKYRRSALHISMDVDDRNASPGSQIAKEKSTGRGSSRLPVAWMHLWRAELDGCIPPPSEWPDNLWTSASLTLVGTGPLICRMGRCGRERTGAGRRSMAAHWSSLCPRQHHRLKNKLGCPPHKLLCVSILMCCMRVCRGVRTTSCTLFWEGKKIP